MSSPSPRRRPRYLALGIVAVGLLVTAMIAVGAIPRRDVALDALPALASSADGLEEQWRPDVPSYEGSPNEPGSPASSETQVQREPSAKSAPTPRDEISQMPRLPERTRRTLERLARGAQMKPQEILEDLSPVLEHAIRESGKDALPYIKRWVGPFVPEFGGRRPIANETAAIATLRNLASAQAQLQATGRIDLDGDGAGEYGYFAELSGGRPMRGSGEVLQPPVLSAAFRKLDSARVKRSGYYFAIHLPDASGFPYAELPEGGAPDVIRYGTHADYCETVWCAYAWPIAHEEGTQRVFFTNQQGDVLACANETGVYAGNSAPPAIAAFQPDASYGTITGKVAVNVLGNDGHQWTVIR